jgi:antitoxin (DNA-binding transcriptional repressor) of toxin-antitoxin stability system
MAEHNIESPVDLRDLVRRAAQGEEMILSEAGRPVAMLASIPPARGPRVFGSARGSIHMADDFDSPLEDFKDYV